MLSSISIISGNKYSDELANSLSPTAIKSAAKFHMSMPMYKQTPLTSLPNLAKKLGIQNIFIKDESYRFGLNAFKGLGAAYAIAKVITKIIDSKEICFDYSFLTSNKVRDKIKDLVFVTATDGNHGKGVAWAASIFGCSAIIYMPKGSKECRAEAIRNINNTKVQITDFNYDATVRFACKYAKEHNYYLIQDTGFEGYEEIPKYITQGYTTMTFEALSQLSDYGIKKPSHVFLQAGVGSMAGSVLGYLSHYYKKNPPITTIVEPSTAACIYESVKSNTGKPKAICGNPKTIMAGLNCGEPNPFTWPILRDYASFYASCADKVTECGMRALAHPVNNDTKITSGESGAVGLGLLISLCKYDKFLSYKKLLNLNNTSNVLIFNTEGNTDPKSYETIING